MTNQFLPLPHKIGTVPMPLGLVINNIKAAIDKALMEALDNMPAGADELRVMDTLYQFRRLVGYIEQMTLVLGIKDGPCPHFMVASLCDIHKELCGVEPVIVP